MEVLVYFAALWLCGLDLVHELRELVGTHGSAHVLEIALVFFSDGSLTDCRRLASLLHLIVLRMRLLGAGGHKLSANCIGTDCLFW